MNKYQNYNVEKDLKIAKNNSGSAFNVLTWRYVANEYNLRLKALTNLKKRRRKK